jgi:NitT/TauT family transport system substrate-binding protein
MNKKIIGALIAVLIIAGAAGAAVVLYSPTPTEGEQVTVMIPYVPNPCYIPHYVGVEKGFYAEEGLNVIIQYTPKGSADAIAQLIGGNAQFIQAGGDSIILARSNNIPVLAAYQVGHENLFGAAVKSETNITSVMAI